MDSKESQESGADPNTRENQWVGLLLSLIFFAIFATIIYVFTDYYLKFSNFYWEIFLGSLIFLFFFVITFPWQGLKGLFRRRKDS